MLGRNKVHYAWRILIYCCCLSGTVSGMVIHCRGVFYTSAAMDIGVDATQYSTYVAVAGIAGVIAMPLVQKMFAKHPLKPLMIGYLTLFFGSQVGMGLVTSMWQCYLFGAIQGVFSSFLTLYPVAYLLKNWFYKNRGMAMGIATMCAGLVSMGMNVFLAKVIEGIGWRAGYIITGTAGFIIAAIVTILFAVRMPKEIGLLPYGGNSNKESADISGGKDRVVLKRKLLKYLVPIGFITVAVYMASGYAQHLSNYAYDLGYPVAFGASLISVCMAGNVVSKLMSGILNDRIGQFVTSYISLASMAVAFILLVIRPINPVQLYIAAFLIGQATSFVVIQIPLLLGCTQLSANEYEACMGAVMIIGSLTGAGHSILVRLLYSGNGSYTLGLSVVAILLAGSVLCMIVFKKQIGRS